MDSSLASLFRDGIMYIINHILSTAKFHSAIPERNGEEGKRKTLEQQKIILMRKWWGKAMDIRAEYCNVYVGGEEK